jgi:hypothetical protein
MRYCLLLLLSGCLIACTPMSLQDVEAYKTWCIKQGGTPDLRITKDNRVMDVMCKKDGVTFGINRRDVF